jgi:hypothetical protein
MNQMLAGDCVSGSSAPAVNRLGTRPLDSEGPPGARSSGPPSQRSVRDAGPRDDRPRGASSPSSFPAALPAALTGTRMDVREFRHPSADAGCEIRMWNEPAPPSTNIARRPLHPPPWVRVLPPQPSPSPGLSAAGSMGPLRQVIASQEASERGPSSRPWIRPRRAAAMRSSDLEQPCVKARGRSGRQVAPDVRLPPKGGRRRGWVPRP